MQKSDKVSTEKNRAAAVALNAEIRRIKARLMEEVPRLQKLVKKKVYFYLISAFLRSHYHLNFVLQSKYVNFVGI